MNHSSAMSEINFARVLKNCDASSGHIKPTSNEHTMPSGMIAVSVSICSERKPKIADDAAHKKNAAVAPWTMSCDSSFERNESAACASAIAADTMMSA